MATVLQILGVSAAEWTALVARPKPGSSDVSDQIFKDLVDNTWEPVLEGDAIKVQHHSCMHNILLLLSGSNLE